MGMKLNEIVEINDLLVSNMEAGGAILYDVIHPYKKSLRTYYEDYFGCEPVLMVTSVSNAAVYGVIVPINELQEYLNDYLGALDPDDREAEEETILFNSKLLKNV